MDKVELMSPVGDKQAFIGAINAGCDALYLAGKKFGARAGAPNFEQSELSELIRFAHLGDVKVYVTVNTLIFDDEINSLLEYTDYLVQNHVDALIVQDFGVMSMLCSRYPNTPIHASTQTNTYSLEQALFLERLGIKRIILARETNLQTAIRIKQNTKLEVEVFVHGALCVSYSGNCLFSSMFGGRSANLGECAQPCRLPYSLVRENEDLNEPSYLLSSKDLMTLDKIPELIESGIHAFKIEGRMRKPEYVIETTRQYRMAINLHYANKTIDTFQAIDRLKRVFNRDYTNGFLFFAKPHTTNQSLRPNHIGVEAGIVESCRQGKLTLRLMDNLQVGDGVRFLSGSDYGMEISRIQRNNEYVKMAEIGDLITLDVSVPIDIGTMMVKTLDKTIDMEAKLFLDPSYKRVPFEGKFVVQLDKPLILTLSALGHTASITSEFIAVLAIKQPTLISQMRDQLDKLGNTPYYWDKLEIIADENLFIPVKILNELRRNAFSLWEDEMTARTFPAINKYFSTFHGKFRSASPGVVAKVETLDQFHVVVNSGIKIIYFNDSLSIEPAMYPGIEMYAVKNRIAQKITTSSPALPSVISDLGQIPEPGIAWIGDQFMNVTNIYSAAFLADHGASYVTLSPELQQSRLESFYTTYLNIFGHNPNLEIVVYGRLDLMISKYCPIAKSTGINRTQCNLCLENQYYLKDRSDGLFPLLNDGFCNIRLLHSKPVFLLDNLAFLKIAGITRFRFDFTTENSEETKTILKLWSLAENNNLPKLEKTRFTTGRFAR